MIHPKALLTIAAIATFPAFIIFSKDSFTNHKNGAFLNIEGKADGFWEQTNSAWTIEKVSESKNLSLRINDFYNISYSISVTKTPSAQTETKGVKGEVCIKNSGGQITENLKIENQIQYKSRGNYKDLTGASQTLSGTQVEPGKKTCTPFRIGFMAPLDATQFRVKSIATITNFFKNHDQEKTKSDTDSFKFPTAPIFNQDSATITDAIQCPQDYTCTPSDTGPWNTSNATVINYFILIKNVHASCSLPTNLKNTATLKENATQKSSSSTNEIPINTGSC